MAERLPEDLIDLPVEGHGRGIRYDAWRARVLRNALLDGTDENSLVIVEATPIETTDGGLADRTDRVHVVSPGVVRTHSRSFSSRDEFSTGHATVLTIVPHDAFISFSDDSLVLSDKEGTLRIRCPFVYRNGRLEVPTEDDLASMGPSPIRETRKRAMAIASRIRSWGHRAMNAAIIAALALMLATAGASLSLVAAGVRLVGDPNLGFGGGLLALAVSFAVAMLFLRTMSRIVENASTPDAPGAFPLVGGLHLASIGDGSKSVRRIEIDEDRFAKPRVSWRGVVRLPKDVHVLLADGSSAFMRADQALSRAR